MIPLIVNKNKKEVEKVYVRKCNIQFKDKKPAAFYNWPMQQWESTLKFYTTVEKLLPSVQNFLAEIDEQGLAKDTQQTYI